MNIYDDTKRIALRHSDVVLTTNRDYCGGLIRNAIGAAIDFDHRSSGLKSRVCSFFKIRLTILTARDENILYHTEHGEKYQVRLTKSQI